MKKNKIGILTSGGDCAGLKFGNQVDGKNNFRFTI